MQIDDEVVPAGSHAPDEREVVQESGEPAQPPGDDDLVQMRVALDDGRGGGPDDVGDVRVGEVASQARDGGRRKDDVADFAKPDKKNSQGSTVASSTSMTGISSLMG